MISPNGGKEKIMEAKSAILAAVGIIIITITLLALTPTIVDQVQATLKTANTPATEWNFTGSDGAKSMMGLVPFIWVAGVLLAAVGGMWSIVRHGED